METMVSTAIWIWRGFLQNVPLHLQFWDTVLHLVSQLELHCAVKDLCHVVGVPAKGL
jgi:hypothetical protein